MRYLDLCTAHTAWRFGLPSHLTQPPSSILTQPLNNSAVWSRILIPKEAFEPYNHLELTQPPSSDLTQPTSSALTQPLSSKLKVLDENGHQIWAQLPLTNLWDIWIYVLHILLEGLVCPLSSPNLSITQLSEVGFWFQKWHCNHPTSLPTQGGWGGVRGGGNFFFFIKFHSFAIHPVWYIGGGV